MLTAQQGFPRSNMKVFLLLCTSLLASSTILRIPCLEYGKFSIIKRNAALQGSLLATFSDTSVDDCEDRCLLDDRCKTVNIKDDDKTCELNSKSADDPSDKVSVVEKIGWTYRSTNYSETQIGELCQDIKPCQDGYICKDTCTCPGYECIAERTDCKSLHARGIRTSGTSMQNIVAPFFPIYCDLVTSNRWWIVFQRRIDASVSFTRGWAEYRKGFGDLDGNFWLGLEKMHQFAAPGRGATLRVEIKHASKPDLLLFAEYNDFSISNEADGYRLLFSSYAGGTAGDSLSYHRDMKFSTSDRDNDKHPANCAFHRKGGFWFNGCHIANLNGLFSGPGKPMYHTDYMTWRTVANSPGGVFYSELKFTYP